jgi:small subunit ribosomal protein S5e
MGDDWDEDVATAPATGAVELVNTAELPEIQLFGKWSCDEVNVSDMSLQV